MEHERDRLNAVYKKRARALVDQMTLEECASQLVFKSPAVPRLGIEEYNWWNEALHGVARAGMATVFPQPIGLASTFDPELIGRIAQAISTEGRAKYNAYRKVGDHGIYKGITFWSPNVNIFRDPRWGRGQETYGEDPFLTAILGTAFVKGLQGDDARFMKTAACAKHYAVHSGPESKRHEFNAIACPRDLTETYLPAFKALVQAGVEGVMGAYNRTNGEPCCGSKTLLQDILVNDWGFDGYITSDCWAIADFHLYHKVTTKATESIALALQNGCCLNCGSIYGHMMEAYEEHLVSEELIRESATRLLTTRMKLGMFDAHTPFDSIGYESVDCEAHRALNYDAACKSLVLLRNNGLLPLDGNALRNVAVLGPNANSIRALEGNYHGTANQYHTVLESIRAALPGVRVNYSVGSHLHQLKLEDPGYSGDRLGEVKTHCELADVVVLVVGLDESIESEDKGSNAGFSGDKQDLLLPQSQQDLVRTVMECGKPTVIVCMSGSALDLGVGNQADAIIQAWYPGALGGKAIGDLILGVFSPSGKLPVTFYTNETALPDFEDYTMDGRTYKFFQGTPLYPFGFGLSYTTIVYSDLEVDSRIVEPNVPITGSVMVHNRGTMDSDEVVQFYVRDIQASVRVPRHALCAVGRVNLRAGEARRVPFRIDAQAFQVISDDGIPFFEKGKFLLYASSCQPDETSARLMGRSLERMCASIELEVL